MSLIAEVANCRVSEVMGTELYTLSPETAVGSARRLALDHGIDQLLVLEEGTLTGIVCREDLEEAGEDELVADCMSSPVLCIGPDTTLEDALQIMIEQDISCLPVVAGTRLVGIVTRLALAVASTSASEEASADPAGHDGLTCGACGANAPRKRVRRDPRAGGIPLCASCYAHAIYSFPGN
jgi:CBS domain-containing protein